MPRRAALLVFALVGLCGCTEAAQYASRQYYPAQPKYVTFYGPWSSTLDEKGLAEVSSAAQLALQDPNATVQVVGFTSTVDADQPAQALSQERAEAVQSQLIADGVDASRVTSMARGATTYQFSPVQAQRVEINIVHAGF